MSEASPRDPPVVRSMPIELRLALWAPLSPLALGAVIWAVLFGVHLLLSWASGAAVWDRADPTSPANSTTHLVFFLSLLIAYVLGVVRWIAVSNSADLVSIAPDDSWIDPGTTRGLPVIGMESAALRRSRWAGAIGLVLALALEIVVLTRNRELASGVLQPTGWWPVAMLLLLGFALGRVGYFTGQVVRDLGRVAAEDVRIDLLDLRPLRVFGRIGLRQALVWLCGASLVIVQGLTDPNPQDVAPALAPILAVLMGIAVFAALALVVPVWSVRRLIRAAKRDEIDRIDVKLRRIRDGAPTPPGQVADLVASRGLVAGLSDWAFDASTLGRFALYLLIPLGSWLGGALVERIVDLWLD